MGPRSRSPPDEDKKARLQVSNSLDGENEEATLEFGVLMMESRCAVSMSRRRRLGEDAVGVDR